MRRSSYDVQSRGRGRPRDARSFLLKLTLVVGIFVILGAVTMGFIFVGDRFVNGGSSGTATTVAANERDTIFENIFLNGVNIGGLTIDQALQRLAEEYTPDITGRQIQITATAATDQSLTITLGELEFEYDFTQGVFQALNYGAGENIQDVNRRLATTPHRITYIPDFSYDDHILQSKLESFLGALEREPQNATGERRDGQLYITEDVVGLSADIPATMTLVRNQIAADTNGTVEAVFKYLYPSVTAESLRNAHSLLGTFYTRTTGAATNPRNINIINAARHINGTVVAPGEEFSTNYHFGAMTYANGYRYAPIILNGQFVDGIGGGVCQVSSTLYMALLFAEMEILERRNHSLRVNYIDWAMDATLAGTWIDLRFRNNTDHPVYVEATVVDGVVTVNIFGYESRPEDRTLTFTPVHLETIPHHEDIIEDDTLPYGERVVETRGVSGQRYALYKTVMQNGTQVDRYRVNTSTYRTINAVVRVGTKNPPDNAYDDTLDPSQITQAPNGSETVSGLPIPQDPITDEQPPGGLPPIIPPIIQPDPTPPSDPIIDPPIDPEIEPEIDLPDLSSWNLPIPISQ